MQRQIRTTPRKRPRQARSKATVDTILEATARVLVKHGFDGLTTNAVATAAGVSIGSLYQYFPNKEALVAALIDRHIEQMNATMLAELARVATLPIARGRARRDRADDPRARDRSRASSRAHRAGAARRQARAAARGRRDLPPHGRGPARRADSDELAIRDPDLAAFMLVSTIESIVHRAALLYPQRLRDPRLVDETTLRRDAAIWASPRTELSSAHDSPCLARAARRRARRKPSSTDRPPPQQAGAGCPAADGVFVASYVTRAREGRAPAG